MSKPIHTYLFLFNKRLNEYKVIIFILPNKCIQYIISLQKMRNLNKSFLYILFIKIIKTGLFEPKHNLKMYVLNIVKKYLV